MNASARPRLPLARYLPLVIFLGFVLLMTFGFVMVFGSRSGVNVRRDSAPFSGLPEDATDVSYYIPGLAGRDVYLEFTSSQEGFETWKAKHEKVQPDLIAVPDENGEMKTMQFEKRATGSFRIEHFNHQKRKPELVEIKDGVTYAWTNGEKGLFLTFDAATNRVYYHAHAD